MTVVPPKSILVITHTGRAETVQSARMVIAQLRDAGIHVLVTTTDLVDLGGDLDVVTVEPARTNFSYDGVEVNTISDDVSDFEHRLISHPHAPDLAIVIGGDGTILRAAQMVRHARVPLLGVNFGHVGFLAETERENVEDVVRHVVAGEYRVEERLALQVQLSVADRVMATTWALNEVSVEKRDRQRLVELVTEVDGRPVSTIGADGVVLATPTGSTAYAFSAGGPVVWPEVEALLMVPISAHALFSRPLVTTPNAVLAVEVIAPENGAVAWCDGRRYLDVPQGGRIEVQRSDVPVLLARLHSGPFTDRLVAKFRLPVDGWRGPRGA